MSMSARVGAYVLVTVLAGCGGTAPDVPDPAAPAGDAAPGGPAWEVDSPDPTAEPDASADSGFGDPAEPDADPAVDPDPALDPDSGEAPDGDPDPAPDPEDDPAPDDTPDPDEPPCALQEFTYDPGDRLLASVHVAGSFNDWDPASWPLQWDADRGLWATERELDDGRHTYKFVLDGDAWVADPTAAETEDDGFDGLNSVRTVDCAPDEGGLCGDVTVFDWRDAVMYFALVDRFHDSDGLVQPVDGATEGDPATGPSGQFAGGDLAGVVDKIPYLTDLGVTALWLSAPYANRQASGGAVDPAADHRRYSTYHGYWPSPADVDWTDPSSPDPRPQVDPRIGDDAGLRAVVEAAHGQDMKVLLDYVMNHVDVDSGLYRAHPDWFARREGGFALCAPENLWDDPWWGTRCAFTDYLPPFDFEVDAARRWSVNDAVWWASEMGIDGYRLDAIKHVSTAWLTDLRQAIDQAVAEPEGGRFYLVGETFAYDDPELIRSFVEPGRMLDGQFDFPQRARLCEATLTRQQGFDEYARWADAQAGFYGPDAVMTTWIGNHDVPRAIHLATGELQSCREGSHAGNSWTDRFQQPADPAAYEQLGVAFAAMLTAPGIPLLYYGDEIGLAGGGDPDNRRLMPWDGLSQAQLALREEVKNLTRLRAANPVLSRGRRTTLHADADTWAFRMDGCGQASPPMIVALNRGDQPVTLELGDHGSIQVAARSYEVRRAAPAR